MYTKNNNGYLFLDPCTHIGYMDDKETIDWELIDSTHNIDDDNPRRLNPIIERSRIWENNIIPYEVDKSQFPNFEDDNLQDILDSVAKEYKEKLGFIIRKRNSKDLNYIKIVNGEGCWSSIGKHFKSGWLHQEMSLQNYGDRNCWRTDIVMHEFGHAFGMLHTHMRQDRDDHIHIIWGNIKNGYYNFFNIYYGDVCDTPYDCGSIMHVGQQVFSKQDGLVTIEPRNSDACIMERTGLTTHDVKCLQDLYTDNNNISGDQLIWWEMLNLPMVIIFVGALIVIIGMFVIRRELIKRRNILKRQRPPTYSDFTKTMSVEIDTNNESMKHSIQSEGDKEGLDTHITTKTNGINLFEDNKPQQNS